MKEFVEKLIGRLEELKSNHSEATCRENMLLKMQRNLSINNAIEIVNQLAEEYKPQLNDNDLMIVQSLPSLYPMKEFEEKALKRVIGCAEEYNNGWIPCSERVPIGEEYRKKIDGVYYHKHMLTTTNEIDVPICVGWYDQEDEQWYDIEGFAYHPIAWMPLPEPYQKGVV